MPGRPAQRGRLAAIRPGAGREVLPRLLRSRVVTAPLRDRCTQAPATMAKGRRPMAHDGHRGRNAPDATPRRITVESACAALHQLASGEHRAATMTRSVERHLGRRSRDDRPDGLHRLAQRGDRTRSDVREHHFNRPELASAMMPTHRQLLNSQRYRDIRTGRSASCRAVRVTPPKISSFRRAWP